MYEQATIAAVNKEAFERMQQGLQQLFGPATVEKLLRQVAKHGFRVRDFEVVLQRGVLGMGAQRDYAVLPDSDRAQMRELYLRLVEQVPSELRKKYMKVYTYY
jgi:hypothetical protein